MEILKTLDQGTFGSAEVGKFATVALGQGNMVAQLL